MKKENVLCISLAELKSHFDMTQASWSCDVSAIDKLTFTYMERCKAEENFDYKQLIPYALLFNERGEVFHYLRCGSEKRLSGLYSAGVGGHLNDTDEKETLYQTIVSGLKREVQEEIGMEISDAQIKMLGVINEDETKVGLCHIGVVFRIDIGDAELQFEKEIGEPEWKSPVDLDLSKFELWSGLAIGLVK